MAIKFPKIFSGGDAKSRIFLVFAAITAVSLIGFLIVHYLGGGPSAAGPSKVATAPSSLQTVPGAQMTPEFYRATLQANAQAAKQAQISGGSAVPTLINIPGQPSGFAEQNCTIVCPSEEKANVADDINNLVKQNKLSQEDANRLLDLAKNNASIDEYAAALDELVRAGKLTPEQARALLDKYKKQHANALINESGALMDSMIKAGQLPLEAATELLGMQRNGISPENYAAQLNRLVRNGKLTPAAANQLLGQYTQQQLGERAKQGAFDLQQMAKAGQITPDVAATLSDLQQRNVPVDDYAANLNRLVAAGKMTPAAAAKLLDQYRKQRISLGPAETLNRMVDQEAAKANAEIADLVKNGKISQDTANALLDLDKNATQPQDYQNGLNKLIQDKKISPQDAQKLLQRHSHLGAVRDEAARLAALQANNASVDDYVKELKRGVQAGLITPDMAATLLNQYRALTTPIVPPGGVAPGVEANVPGGAEFAQLQQRLAAENAAPPLPPTAEAAEFATAEVQANTEAQAALEQARQQRIEAIQAAMSNQAQSLINAWQPTAMVHKEGTPPEKAKGEISASESASGGAGGKGKPTKPALIKAGTILFAILDTAVNSDYPDTPVLATIIDGKFKGAKLLGKLNLQKDKDRVSLNFSLMDMEPWPSAKSVNAFAIDPDTAKTVMASKVDYHYLQRYGAIFATSFLTGYSNAITQAGTTTVGVNGITTTHPELNPSSKFMVGLGQVGTTLGGAVQNYINIPNTVKVNSGVGLGILFMGEVTE